MLYQQVVRYSMNRTQASSLLPHLMVDLNPTGDSVNGIITKSKQLFYHLIALATESIVI